MTIDEELIDELGLNVLALRMHVLGLSLGETLGLPLRDETRALARRRIER